jgi:hypothetical protein
VPASLRRGGRDPHVRGRGGQLGQRVGLALLSGPRQSIGHVSGSPPSSSALLTLTYHPREAPTAALTPMTGHGGTP